MAVIGTSVKNIGGGEKWHVEERTIRTDGRNYYIVWN